ncbi:tpt-domain-containing protein [Phaffia rhodozyma]|uniref:Tpt-domain-containing protein n=1 Tax=Phaffia rhodozyma TaxID=264483 RepID=A0A0F7STA0_PHARH|nr:tpt-domain-containing protein [Phaffia rhodozyma]
MEQASSSYSPLVALEDPSSSARQQSPRSTNTTAGVPKEQLPSHHIGPVRSLSSYDPADLNGPLGSPRNSIGSLPPYPSASASGSGAASSSRIPYDDSLDGRKSPGNNDDDDEDEDAWDDWGDGTDARSSTKAESSQPNGISTRRYSEDAEEGDLHLERELKAFDEQLEKDGLGDNLEIERRKKMYWRETAITAFFVLLWYGFSTLLSLYNKWVFGVKYFAFPFPMFMTFCQMIVQFVLASIVRFTMPQKFKPPYNPSVRDYGYRLVPTGISTAGDIGLSNLSLKTISLSLYTMCKSSSLIFVLFFAFLFHLERFSWKLILVITLITTGVILMAFNTTAVSLPGILMVLTASVLGGLRWALTHTLMIKKELGMSNPFATIFWISPVMAIALGFVSLIQDGWGEVFGSEFFEPGRVLFTILVIIFPGFLAFAMVASEYYIIQRAGVVPLSVAGVFKEVTTISIASWAFGDELTPINLAGLFVTVTGIAVFTHHKYQKSIHEPSEHGDHSELSSANGIGRYPSSTSLHGGDDEEHLPLTALRRSEEKPRSIRRSVGDDFLDDDDDEELARRRVYHLSTLSQGLILVDPSTTVPATAHLPVFPPDPPRVQSKLVDRLPDAWTTLENDYRFTPFMYDHNRLAITHLEACLRNATCPHETTRIVLLQYSYYKFADGSSTRGEDLWAISVLDSLDRLGYTSIMVNEYATDLMNWHRVFEDYVAVYIVETIPNTGTKGFYHCLLSNECIRRPTFPKGIPLGKVLVQNWWETTPDPSVPDYPPTLASLTSNVHPLGGKWIMTPYEFGDHFYLGYTVTCDGEVVPPEERDPRALFLAKQASYFYGGVGSPGESAYPRDHYTDLSQKTGLDFTLVAPDTSAGIGDQHPVPEGVVLYPLEKGRETLERKAYESLVAKSTVMVGLGFPGCSPSPYYALCKGVPFINPHQVDAPPQSEWHKTNSIFRWQSYQHGPLAAYSAPYVYNVPYDDTVALERALLAAKENPIGSFVPEEMKSYQMDQRVRKLMETDWETLGEARLVELGVAEVE